MKKIAPRILLIEDLHHGEVLNKTCSFYPNVLLLCNNSVTWIDNTQLSLYMGYKRKVSLLPLSSDSIIFNTQLHLKPILHAS
jgi:hypothetical protein